MKTQTVLQLIGDMERERSSSTDYRRRKALRQAVGFAEWYAGFLMQKSTGWSDEEIAKAGFSLNPPTRSDVKRVRRLLRVSVPPAGGVS